MGKEEQASKKSENFPARGLLSNPKIQRSAKVRTNPQNSSKIRKDPWDPTNPQNSGKLKTPEFRTKLRKPGWQISLKTPQTGVADGVADFSQNSLLENPLGWHSATPYSNHSYHRKSIGTAWDRRKPIPKSKIRGKSNERWTSNFGILVGVSSGKSPKLVYRSKIVF